MSPLAPPPGSAADALRCEGVTVRYGTHTAIAGVDLAIAPGEVHVVVGPSGSGKSTLLRAIAGFSPIAQGRVTMGGALVDDGSRRRFVPPERRGVGVVFQDYALFPHLDLRANVGFGLPRRDRGRAEDFLERVDLGALAARRPAELSGGEQQRVSLARALATAPTLMLLDEPFSNLDKSLRTRLRHETFDLVRESGAAALLITHDAEEALAVADRVSVLCAGRLLQTGTGPALYDAPSSKAAALCLGDADFVPARACGDGTAETPLGAVSARGEGAWAVVRPERVVVEPADAVNDTAGAEARGLRAARVLRRSFLGPVTELTLEVGGSVVRARVLGSLPQDGADRVWVGVRGEVALVRG
jgi:iron(III) transport system ATP-binding protein